MMLNHAIGKKYGPHEKLHSYRKLTNFSLFSANSKWMLPRTLNKKDKGIRLGTGTKLALKEISFGSSI